MNFILANKSTIKKISINGWEWFIDVENLILYEKVDSTDGINVRTYKHLTENEKTQIYSQTSH